MTEPVPLARLFAIAYRQLVDGLHERLAERGWTDVRPAFGFLLLALRAGPASLGDLPGVLGTSKQAVSKLVDRMVAAGYVERVPDPGDGRAKQVRLSSRGQALLAEVERIWVELEAAWEDAIGGARLAGLRSDLEQVLRSAHGGALPPVRTVA
ncbi:MarR family winged helix-turn-helix transcriptional regulator [Blastococcus tunisiensis]|uniref:DNA-binding transcriptional regulator, MarR family n=1 Tax=Blastococcus tunisiensis TaxID=1798228 RepID=A0A1I2J3G1_9ACTN|nr:MarR family transcriptional regulator [Blastococcus sp. DSM 46838]SFF49215.1 DNA-binding transcriptional regulator, MarR family [Blastococcus sp. DSM 46838]